jgi:hypothetical protein
MFAFFSNRLGCLARFSSRSSAQSFFLQYFAVAARTGKFVCESKTRTKNNKGRADVRQRMPTFKRPLEAALRSDVRGDAPAEAALDQVFLSFVPFQNPDRNAHAVEIEFC